MLEEPQRLACCGTDALAVPAMPASVDPGECQGRGRGGDEAAHQMIAMVRRALVFMVSLIDCSSCRPCWRYANKLLTDRQQDLDWPYDRDPKYSRLDPAQRREQILDAANALFAERAYDEVSIEDIASCRRRHPRARAPLLRRSQGGLLALVERIGALREERLPPPVGRSARARVADNVSRWLDWTEANRTIWLATLARGEDIADPEVRQVVADLVRRAVALLDGFSRRHRRGLAAAALRAGVLDRTQPRRDATLADAARRPARRHTNCSPRRSNTSCAPSALAPAPNRRPSPP